MKKLLIIGALVCAPVFAITVSGGKVQFLPAEQEVLQRCEAEGGCYVFTVAMVEAYARAMVQQYMQAVAEQFEGAVKQEAKRICGGSV